MHRARLTNIVAGGGGGLPREGDGADCDGRRVTMREKILKRRKWLRMDNTVWAGTATILFSNHPPPEAES